MDEHLLEVYLINTARHTEETPVAEWVSLPTDAETMKAVFRSFHRNTLHTPKAHLENRLPQGF